MNFGFRSEFKSGINIGPFPPRLYVGVVHIHRPYLVTCFEIEPDMRLFKTEAKYALSTRVNTTVINTHKYMEFGSTRWSLISSIQ